jgi:hypothetical protein
MNLNRDSIGEPALDFEAWRVRIQSFAGRYNPEGIEPSVFAGWCTRRAHYAKQKIRERLCEPDGLDPHKWDFPPKPKWMRRATYERWKARFDQQDMLLDEALADQRALSGKVETGFPKRSCSNKKITLESDSTRLNQTLAPMQQPGFQQIDQPSDREPEQR